MQKQKQCLCSKYLFNVTLEDIQSYLDMQKPVMPEDRKKQVGSPPSCGIKKRLNEIHKWFSEVSDRLIT